MFAITRQSDGSFLSSGKNWEVGFDSPKPGLFTFKLDKNLSLTSRFAVIDNLEESTALHDRRKVHLSNDEQEAQFDTFCKIPFGAEPAISRKFKLSEGFLSVTTDFEIRTSFQIQNLFAGGYVLTGSIARFAVISAPKTGVHPATPDWKDFGSLNDKTVLYDSALPPVSLLVETMEGTVLELATGEDFWRWTTSAQNTSSRYTLTKNASGMEAAWIPYAFKPQAGVEVPAGRNRRMSFYLAWRKDSKTKKAVKYKDVFDMAAYEWPETHLAVDSAGNPVKGAPCFSSDGVINILKKWVRRNLAEIQDGDVLAVTNVSPVFCCSAAHQDRAKMKFLPHLDIYGLNEFKHWANRQLIRKGAKLAIVSAKDVSLPSISDAGVFPAGEQVGRRT